MSRSLVLYIAQQEDTTAEYPAGSNRTKYGKWFGNNGQLWCSAFVCWVFHQAGYRLPYIDHPKGFALCANAFFYFRRQGQLTKNPQEGDIVLYDFHPDDGRIADHTGIFVRWIDPDTFEAWEGNTGLRNDRDGGRVMLRKRNKTQYVWFADPGVYPH
jgi:hypothetical protein